MEKTLSNHRLKLAENIKGFMPPKEGMVLYESALKASAHGPMLEVGSYCGKSAIYLGSAAEQNQEKLFSLDHHRGSEENQPGWEHHDPDLLNPQTGLMDSFPYFRKNIHKAGLEDFVIAIVGNSMDVAKRWETPLSLLFIDGGHGVKPAHNDYENWSDKLQEGGLLLIHDVYEESSEGGRPPYEIYNRAINSKKFKELRAVHSLRVLRKVM